MLTDLRRTIASKFPWLHKLLLPLWIWYVHKLWQSRNIFFEFVLLKLKLELIRFLCCLRGILLK